MSGFIKLLILCLAACVGAHAATYTINPPMTATGSNAVNMAAGTSAQLLGMNAAASGTQWWAPAAGANMSLTYGASTFTYAFTGTFTNLFLTNITITGGTISGGFTNDQSGLLQGRGSSLSVNAITGTANAVPKWSATAPYLTSTSLITDDGAFVAVAGPFVATGAGTFGGQLTGTDSQATVGVGLIGRNMNTGAGGGQIVELELTMADTAGSSVVGSQLAVHKDQEWTSTASTRDGNLRISTVENNSLTESLRIGSDGKTTISRGNLVVTNGNLSTAVSASATGTYNVTANESFIPISASGGAVTVNLPTAVAIKGRQYVLKRTDTTTANTVTVDGSGSETIDGSLTITIGTRADVTLISDGANWHVINSSVFNSLTATVPSIYTGTLPNPLAQRVAQLIPTGSSTTLDGIGDSLTTSLGGSGIAPTAADGFMLRYTSGAVIGNQAYWQGRANYRRSRNIRFVTWLRLESTADERVWVGFSHSSLVTLLASDAPAAYNMAALRYSPVTASDTTWKAVTHDGSTQTVTDTTIAPGTTTIKIEIIEDTTAGNIKFYIQDVLGATVTTTLPTTTQDMYVFAGIETRAASAKYIEHGRSVIIADK